MEKNHEALFQPIKIGQCLIKNRYAMAPMGCFGMTDAAGIPTEECIEYYVRRAQGGAGLIITGLTIVEDRFEKNVVPSIWNFSARISHQALKAPLCRLTQRVHAWGAKIFVQLSAGFGRAGHYGEFVEGAVAPSPVENRFKPEVLHRALTAEEIGQYVHAFGRQAAFAKSVGFDGVEVHALHEGYLLDQFATEYYNRRTDQYGGSFENRYRFSVEILQAIKSACGQDFPVSMRYSLKHYMKGERSGAVPGEVFEERGRDEEEGLRAARYLEQNGYDALNVDVGCYDAHFWSHPNIFHEDGMYLPAAQKVKQAVSIPVLVAGRMDNPARGAQAIAAGKCDMVALARPLLADPDIPKKVAAGNTAEIRPCIGCNYGCAFGIARVGTIGCAVNAACTREQRYAIEKAPAPKKILVVGGGPAGMEAARVASLRGHRVTLMESGRELGGMLIPAAAAPFKFHNRELVAWYRRQLAGCGVALQLGAAANEDTIRACGADIVLFATGARPVIPPIPGADLPHVHTAQAAHNTPAALGNRVLVVGAGQVGCEMAVWLAQAGRQVAVVDQLDCIMAGGYRNDVDMVKGLFSLYGVRLYLSSSVGQISAGHAVLNGAGGSVEVPLDTVVLATGYRPNAALYQQVKTSGTECYLLGDALQVGNVYHAIHTAYELARSL